MAEGQAKRFFCPQCKCTQPHAQPLSKMRKFCLKCGIDNSKWVTATVIFHLEIELEDDETPLTMKELIQREMRSVENRLQKHHLFTYVERELEEITIAPQSSGLMTSSMTLSRHLLVTGHQCRGRKSLPRSSGG